MMHLALDYIDASDTWLAGTTTAVTLTGDWTRYSVGQASAPTGTDHVDFSLYVGGVDDGDTIDVCADGALLEKSASLGSYVDGESDSASWDAEENASTSTLALGWRVDYLYDEAGMPYGGLYRENGAGPLAFLMIISDRGDVLELLDADGNPFVAYRYDVWGKPLGAGNHATGVWTQQTTDAQSNVVISADLAERIADRQVLRYAGYAYDAESGLYYCSARYYDPLTCQFLTRDPAKADGEESAYQYCGGCPTNGVDPTGASCRTFSLKRRIGKDCTAYFRRVLRVDAAWAARHNISGTWNSPSVMGWFNDMVKDKAPWDFKYALPARSGNSKPRLKKQFGFRGRLISVADFGNVHYGYVGRAACISLQVLQWASWDADGYSFPVSENEQKDQSEIKNGWRLYKKWGMSADGLSTYYRQRGVR